MACFCAAGIAHFCKLPRLPPRRQCPLSFFLQMARIGPPTLRPLSFFANGPDWARHRSARYQKLSNPPLPLFARSADCTRFLRLIFFRHKLAVLQNCTHFYIFHLFAKNSAFCMCRNFKGIFGFFYFRACLFKKQHLFCVCKKSGSILSTQKEGGFFILSHQNSTLN